MPSDAERRKLWREERDEIAARPLDHVRLERCSGAACRARDANGRAYEGKGLLCTAESLSVAGMCVHCARRAPAVGDQLQLG